MGQALRGGLGKLTALARARRALRGKKGDTCLECRAIGKQRFRADVCGRSGAACVREAAVREAEVNLVSWEAREALRLWAAIGSQWRAGMGGAYGLDYVALYRVAETLGVEIDEEVLGLVQVLEAEQVEAWNVESERTKSAGAAAPGKLKGAVKRG